MPKKKRKGKDIFKKALPRSEGVSVLPMDEYIPLFYSVNEILGLANIPAWGQVSFDRAKIYGDIYSFLMQQLMRKTDKTCPYKRLNKYYGFS